MLATLSPQDLSIFLTYVSILGWGVCGASLAFLFLDLVVPGFLKLLFRVYCLGLEMKVKARTLRDNPTKTDGGAL